MRRLQVDLRPVRYYFLSVRTSHPFIIRLPPPISDTSAPRALSTARREVICGRDRQAQQMVDVIPEKTVHEQKFGNMKFF